MQYSPNRTPGLQHFWCQKWDKKRDNKWDSVGLSCEKIEKSTDRPEVNVVIGYFRLGLDFNLERL